MDSFYKVHGINEKSVIKEQLKQEKFQEIMEKFEMGKLTYQKRGSAEKVTNKKQAFAMAQAFEDKHWSDGYVPSNQRTLEFLMRKKPVVKLID